jgi:hypothetical protein
MRCSLLAIALLTACSAPAPSVAASDASAPLTTVDAMPALDAAPDIMMASLWIGQSNAGQQGLVSQLTGADIELGHPFPNVGYCAHELENPAATAAVETPWQELAPLADHLGFEMAFGRAMGAGNAVVKYMVGRSGSVWWAQQDEYAAAGRYFAARLAERHAQAAEIVIIQGESESAQTVGVWAANWSDGVAVIRAAVKSPDLSVVLVRTHIGVSAPGLREAQDSFAAQVGARVINTDGVPQEARPHWMVPGVNQIGKTIAATVVRAK